MRTPLPVSIIVPCFNSAWSLPRLAESLRQISVPQFEIVFVDDGSVDGSGDLFRHLCPEAIIVSQENRGLGASRNRAAEIASGEFLQLLDADDTIEPGKLSTQVEFAHTHDLDVVYSNWRMVIVDQQKEFPSAFDNSPAPAEIVEALLGGWWYPPNAALVKRKAFLCVGGCDPTLGNTVEDFDLWVRLGIAGRRFGYVPGNFASYYRYLQHVSMTRKNRRELFEGEQRIIFKALGLLEGAGALTLARRRAAARRLHFVARNVYPFDREWFSRLLMQVYQLDPHFRPSGSWLYTTTARWLGMENTERLALSKRSWRI